MVGIGLRRPCYPPHAVLEQHGHGLFGHGTVEPCKPAALPVLVDAVFRSLKVSERCVSDTEIGYLHVAHTYNIQIADILVIPGKDGVILCGEPGRESDKAKYQRHNAVRIGTVLCAVDAPDFGGGFVVGGGKLGLGNTRYGIYKQHAAHHDGGTRYGSPSGVQSKRFYAKFSKNSPSASPAHIPCCNRGGGNHYKLEDIRQRVLSPALSQRNTDGNELPLAHKRRVPLFIRYRNAVDEHLGITQRGVADARIPASLAQPEKKAGSAWDEAVDDVRSHRGRPQP